MTRPKVALATATRLPSGMEDTAGLVDALDQAGLDSELVVWTDAAIEWTQYAATVLHSPWDYTERVRDFLSWVSTEGADGKMLNSVSTLAWNADKRYLLDLEQRGVRLPRTVCGSTGRAVSVAEIKDAFGSAPTVVKPVVSAGGRKVWRCDSARAAQEVLLRHVPDEPVLVQRYEPSVQTHGEYSSIFLAGELSHTVRKIPQGGDFRVQSHFGGRTELVNGAPWIEAYGKSVLSAVADPPQYARVDFVLGADREPLLIELELIEPDLFLRYAPESYGRFAEIVASNLVSA